MSQMGQEDSLRFMGAAVHTFCLQSQVPFESYSCLSVHKFSRIPWVQNSYLVLTWIRCCPTLIVRLQHFIHAVMQIPEPFYIWHTQPNKVMTKPIFAQWIVILWFWQSIILGFGCGKHYCDILIHIICYNLGPSKSLALPLFHSLTGCDTT